MATAAVAAAAKVTVEVVMVVEVVVSRQEAEGMVGAEMAAAGMVLEVEVTGVVVAGEVEAGEENKLVGEVGAGAVGSKLAAGVERTQAEVGTAGCKQVVLA